MATCITCKKEWPESRMILSSRGMVCPECDLQRETESALFRGTWLTVMSGPGLAFSVTIGGLLGSCAGPLVGGGIWLLGGIAVLGNAIRAALLLKSLRVDYADSGVGTVPQVALGVSAAFSGFWGFWLVLGGGWAMISSLIAM